MEDPPPPEPDAVAAASPPREEVDPSPPPPLPSPAPPRQRLLLLSCAVQHYEWGRRGGASLVARLAGVPDPDPTRPYAELWMGTHPSGPSTLLHDGTLLGDWLARNPDALGPAVAARWGGDLPFLFKVLSVAKALSIQAHPDKKLAEVLHALRPSTYKDSNHKPEMAIAVTEFRAICGFVGIEELKDILRTVPEIDGLIGHEVCGKIMSMKECDGGNEVKSSLQAAFAKLMTASRDMIRTLTEKEQLVLSLARQYQEDVGVLAVLFFNYVKLSPGEALYIGANEPHAYLSGECIECMATSDNVVRAGLTPKYRDVQTLCSMLTYRQIFPEILRGTPVQPYVRRYTPPFDEFEVDCCLVPPGEVVVISPVPGPSIFIVMTGEGEAQVDSMTGEKAKEGVVFFIPAYTEVKLSACGPEFMQLYRAGVNSSTEIVRGPVGFVSEKKRHP
ncbi:hypothetical protein PR202_ga23617 [Eleusine coracana subsp. coracana]|uniref:Mannose-6-phosphate isomerase n=1 Tax=Eleusine coracana subsp. coracana TaxID=191504 RepID=A0AAV5D4Q8_ELECO|nr:hypothetical protein PR202_ga23617 [Eleusine coracana subsp. coracana]